MNTIRHILIYLLMTFSMNAMSQHLPQRLDSILTKTECLKYSSVGILVYDLTTDSVIYSHNDTQLGRPASTMKLLTAITALDCLGKDYTYHTTLRYSHDKTQDTLITPSPQHTRYDLYIKGTMDPLLTDEDLEIFARQIRISGIDTITGNIYADRSFVSTPTYGKGWCWDDDNPILSPLVYHLRDSLIEKFSDILRQDSITLLGNTSIAFTPKGAKFLADITHTLSDVLLPTLKNSNNLCAESIFYNIAAYHGLPATADKARQTELSVLHKAMGVTTDSLPPLLIADGSGLSLYNYLSPQIEVSLLRYAYHHRKRIFDTLYAALPIAGIDGTLRNRMKDSTAQGNVHAKTGTLTGISTLAGYCTTATGHLLAFSIMNQNILNTADAHSLQDTICISLTK